VTVENRLPAAQRAVESVLEAIDLSCSRFRPDSELSRLNEANGRWVPVGPLLFEALEAALWAARTTGGLVDPTVGGSLRALGYDRDFKTLPEDDPIPLQLQVVPGWRSLEVDSRQRRVRIPAGVELDLGATAKGLAADKSAAAAIGAAGEGGVLVSLGGDIAVAGEPPAEGWLVLVTEDANADETASGDLIYIKQGGLATSSTTVRQWRKGGKVLHHIVDPATGLPAVSPWLSASVCAATCLEANTASTAAILMGDRAPQWLEELRLPARLVHHDHSVERIAGWPD
jgi:thiamine biosynthesis lipoprotein